jgi:mannose/fructose-specific phosphotransferase system component IIA
VISLQRRRQVADACETLTHAAELVSGLEKEIRTRQAALEAIEADIAANRVLASIDQWQAAGIIKLMDAATATAHRRLLRANRVDQIVFFLAGVIVSVVVQLVVNWL